jgi:hypothetical protein
MDGDMENRSETGRCSFETFSVGSVSVFYLYQRNRATEGALAKRRRCNHIAKTWLEWTLGRAYRA